GVILASSLTEYARESGDDPISAGVTVSVVDRLEVIEVAQDERDGRLASGVAGQDTVQPFSKAAAVEQAGEGVRARLFGDLVKQLSDQDHEDQQRDCYREYGTKRLRQQGIGGG